MKTIIHRTTAVLLVLLLALGVPGPARVQAAPLVVPGCLWTGGGVNSNWDTAGNWATIPSYPTCSGLSAGMTVTLAFPDGASKMTSSTNNLSNLHVVDLGIETGGYNIGGNQILLSHGIGMIGAGSSTLSMPIQLTAGIEVNINATSTLHLTGAISGIYGITKTGAGTLDLGSSTSTFAGGVTIIAGKVNLSQIGAGGSGTIEVQDGKTLTISSPVTYVTNPLNLSGAGVGGLGAVHFEGSSVSLTGAVTLGGSTTIQSTNPDGVLLLTNAISGPSDKTLTLDGPAFTFSGVYSNTFAGLIAVPRGTLTLNRGGGATAVAGNLTVGPGDGVVDVGVMTLTDNQFSSASQVTLNTNTVFNLQGHSQTIGGMAALNRPCQVLLGGDQNTTLTFNTISGPQNYVNCDVTGTGTLLVKGNQGNQSFENNDPANPFNGSLDVQGSAASYLDAFHMGGPYYLHQNTGGGLSSGSMVGSLLADNAWLSLQLEGPAVQSQAGSLILNGAGTDAIFEFMSVDARGLKVTGLVSLGSAALFVCYFTGFEPGLANTPGNPNWRTLVQNDTAAAVTGTFNGLPEGSQISADHCLQHNNPFPMRLSYQGGDGNDVVVTRLVEDTLALQVIPIPTFGNQAVNLVAVLSAVDNPAGAVPGKKVAFYDGAQLIGEASFSGLTAMLSGVRFAGGSHSVQARLVGDPNFADASSNTANFSVIWQVFLPTTKK